MSSSFRLILGPAFLAGALAFATASAVHADDDCQKRTIKADHQLHEAVAKHGPQSPEADKARRALSDARHYCWQHDHRWWDEDAHSWHDKQDWDDHDHDH
jgi:hypothetical protein